MAVDSVIQAEPREQQGKGASRRLRRSGKIPAVLYGAGKEPMAIALDHQKILHSLQQESFYSQILTIELNGEQQRVVLRDLQRHPSKPAILHLDLLRVREDEAIKVHVPLHFVGEDVAPGVKFDGGMVSHHVVEVEVSCLPKDLPEFIDVDLSNGQLNDSVHLSDLRLPTGVELLERAHGTEDDRLVANIHLPKKVVEIEEELAAEAAAAAEAEAEAEAEEGVEPTAAGEETDQQPAKE